MKAMSFGGSHTFRVRARNRWWFRAIEMVLAWSAVGALVGYAQTRESSRQTFQSRIDLITVDVAVLDKQGHPVADLGARDFQVKLGGRSRDVVAANLVKVDSAQPPLPVESADPLVSTNVTSPGSRKVVVAVDQTLIRPTSVTPLIRTAEGFIDHLGPQDYAAFLAFPEPGPHVDFTTDKARVRMAMRGVVGQPSKSRAREFNISLTEAVIIANSERTVFDPMRENPLQTAGINTQRVLERGCSGKTPKDLTGDEVRECLIRIQQEAVLVATDARQESDISLRRLERLLADLGPTEGPKSLILVSGGLLIENLALLDEVVRLAAASRTSVSVVYVDVQSEQTETRDLANSQSAATLQDRLLELQGLQTIADRTGGSFIRFVAGNGAGIFDRLAAEMSAWYIVAVERQPGDPDEQQVEVSVKRRGVTVRANRTVVATDAINAARPSDEVLSEALSSPIPITGVGLRVSTFAQRDATSGKYRLLVAAQLGQPGAAAGEFALGYIVINRATDKVVTSVGRRLTLAPDDDKGPLRYDTALSIDPGAYALRFGVVDGHGLRGTVVREIDLAALDGHAVTTSDLIIGEVPAEGQPMHPAVEPHVAGGRLAGYLEIYPPEDTRDLAVGFEVAEGAASPALASAALNIGSGERPELRTASGAIDLSLLPGRYVARATVRKGTDVVRVLTRPFVIDARSEPTRATEVVRGAAVTPDMRRRTAAYVSQVVGGLSNIVGEERFTLSDPNRRVTSDFLLVRYPGSDRDFLSFRDVTLVNGKAIPDHEERVTELFLKPIGMVRDRVRQITGAAEQYVPTVFNPVFVLAFLQADFQARFQWTVGGAGADWPPQVKAVTFVEIARPTLLRAGLRGDQDVPTKGTAWVEEATGRVLQTELQLGAGRNLRTIVTRFALDERLQIIVPAEMHTTNPAGAASYGNFRRFSVQTSTDVPSAAR